MAPFGPFELFRRLANRNPVWVGSCASLESAWDRVRELPSGDYFVFDRHHNAFIAVELRKLSIPSRAHIPTSAPLHT
jgi:hypothetical protein